MMIKSTPSVFACVDNILAWTAKFYLFLDLSRWKLDLKSFALRTVPG